MSNESSVEQALRRAHMRLMRHKHTAHYCGVLMSGVSEVKDDVPTACTDGLNKFYGRKFCGSLATPEQTAIVLHENLHVQLKHVTRCRWAWKIDPRLANWCMDQVVNNIINDIPDKDLVKLPQSAVLDVMFRNWSFNQVWAYMNEGRVPPTPTNPTGGNSQLPVSRSKDGKPVPNDSDDYDTIKVGNKSYRIPEQGSGDEHDFENGPSTSEEIKEFEKKVDDAVQQGAILAGRNKVDLPRAVKDLLSPPVNWRDQLSEWFTAQCSGKDDLTWRRYNRRYVAQEIYLPSEHSETIDEVIIACDMSGSISEQIPMFLGAIADLCDAVKPKRLRVLWWGTTVVSEQVFEDDLSQIRNALRPRGGGGTCVSSVSKYIIESGYNPDCVLVFTDGYVESDIKWHISSPTLWMIMGNDDFVPPVGGTKIAVSQ